MNRLGTMMRAILMGSFLAVLVPCLARGFAQDGAGPEYDRRARELYAAVAGERLKLALDLSKDGLHAWARLEYAKLLFRDSENEETRKALGFRREDGEWKSGGEGISTVNKATHTDVEKGAKKYHARMNTIAKDAATRHLELAAWCVKSDLKVNARVHYLESLACDPENTLAATALGFKTSDTLPLASDPETVEIFRAFRKDSKKVPAGEEKTAEDGWGDELLRKQLKIVYGKRIGIESSWMEPDAMKELARWGDHTFDIVHQLLGVTSSNEEKRYWFAYLTDEEFKTHMTWEYRDRPNDVADRDRLLKGPGYRDDYVAQKVTRWRSKQHPQEPPLDDAAHLVAQFAITRRLWKGDPSSEAGSAAIQEGFAVLCEFMGPGTNNSWCAGIPSTVASNKGQGSKRYVYRDFAAEAAETIGDAPVTSLFKMGFDGLNTSGTGAKAASLQEFLFARGRKNAVEFLKAIAEGKDVAETIRSRYGWCPEEMDEHWRRWAIAIAKKTEKP